MKPSGTMMAGAFAAALLLAATASVSFAQQSVPQNITQPKAKNSKPKTRTVNTDARKAPISSELTGTPGDDRAADLSRPAAPVAVDPRIPFGALSLGLKAEAAPRSNDLSAAPLPSGMEQFKKDRFDPYVGLSIIDIKR